MHCQHYTLNKYNKRDDFYDSYHSMQQPLHLVCSSLTSNQITSIFSLAASSAERSLSMTNQSHLNVSFAVSRQLRNLKIERTHLQNLRQSLQDLVIETMAARTLRELTNPELTQQTLAITSPPLRQGVTFELKSGVINLLPKFHGLASEDPIMHLSEFHDICMCSKPSNVTEEQIKMRAFGFTLKDGARNLYYHLPTGTITTWAQLHKAFLDKYFPANKATALKRAISNVEQADDESLGNIFRKI